MDSTSVTLLGRLKDAGPDAAEWKRFHDLYLPFVRSFLLSRLPGLGTEAEDLLYILENQGNHPELSYSEQWGFIIRCDHLPDVNPTAENIAKLIFDYAASQGFPVVEVQLWETENCFASYTGPQGP